jgi:ribosomal protein S18 acetylase RimI-like enzyme
MPSEAVRFHKSLIKDFYKIHNQRHKAGWCFCVAWWVDSWNGWSERSAAENRNLREELLAMGEFDGYLLYFDHEPSGWCQVGVRDRLKKLTQQFSLDADPDTWAITCFLILPEHRRTGAASNLLRLVLADLRSRGVKRVEAYPRRGESLDEMEMWNGPESMYLRAGFNVVIEDDRRPVLSINLASPAAKANE